MLVGWLPISISFKNGKMFFFDEKIFDILTVQNQPWLAWTLSP